jgi:hemerythrin-like domain-containing protein
MNTTTAGDSAGIADPLAMLSTCCARIGHHLAALQRLVDQLADGGPDEDAQVAVAQLIEKVDPSLCQHHADEEEDLFPALIEAMAGSDAVCVREMTAHLSAQHRELAARWRRVRVQLERLAAGERALIERADVDALIDLHQRHIEREERELLPMAARLLSDDDVVRIGRAMRARRGIASG